MRIRSASIIQLTISLVRIRSFSAVQETSAYDMAKGLWERRKFKELNLMIAWISKSQIPRLENGRFSSFIFNTVETKRAEPRICRLDFTNLTSRIKKKSCSSYSKFCQLCLNIIFFHCAMNTFVVMMRNLNAFDCLILLL